MMGAEFLLVENMKESRIHAAMQMKRVPGIQ